MHENLKTVVELANELSVSKQTVFYNANKLDLTLIKHDNVSYVTTEQEEILTERINSNKRKTSHNTSNKRSNDDNTDILEVLTEQLKEKDKQIQNLSKLLENQQVLALESNKKIKKLEVKLEEKEDKSDDSNINALYKDLKENENYNQSEYVKAESDDTVSDKAERKNGLFSRFFGR